MKKILFIFLVLFLFIHFAGKIYAQNTTPSAQFENVDIVVFLRLGCTHCNDEEKFLDDLKQKRHDIIITKYRLENHQERDIWDKFTDRVQTSKVTPITVIGETYIIGFDKNDTTGKEIISLIETTKRSRTKTDLSKITSNGIHGQNSSCDENGLVSCSAKPTYYVSLPIIGKIDAQKYPLVIISAILGFFDGFNPCAMWVLVTFLIILLQVGNRRKMFVFAGIFILAEAIMYSLILTIWYKTWDFVKLDTIITPIVGSVAILGGIFFLREWRKKELECKVTNATARQKTRQKITELATSKFTLISFLTILGIAFSVNIIEFACSIGIPQAFTKILELNQLSFFQSGLFIVIYIFFYMLDDFLVFGIALYGADKLAITTKYSKLSNLLGGVVMIILGLILILKPNFLLF